MAPICTRQAAPAAATRSAAASQAPAALTIPTDVIEISSDDESDSGSDVVVEKVVPAPPNTPFSEYGGYYSPTAGTRRKKKRKATAPTTPKTPEQELHDTAVLAARMLDQNAALPSEVKSMYSQVAWCRLRGWPYWPGYVCSPQMLAVDADTMETFVPLMTTHYWIYFYNCNKSAAVPHASVAPWDDTSKPYRDGFPAGGAHRTIGLADAVDMAEKEYKLAADERVAWVVTRVKKKESALAVRKIRRRQEHPGGLGDEWATAAQVQLKGAPALRQMQEPADAAVQSTSACTNDGDESAP